MKVRIFAWLFFCILTHAHAARSVVNVYVWGGEIPKQVIHAFERSTGIKVNFSTYESNETLYAKLKANKHGIYDVILPSSYYVERMRTQGMLTPLDKTQLSHLSHLDPFFTNNDYDPHNQYSIPLIWGTTGIFYNQNKTQIKPTSWQDLWHPQFKNALLLLDDAREVFSMALLHLGYTPNDANPQHIKEAYETLLSLTPNIKLFTTEGIQALLIDEDVDVGMAWNGDAYKARVENKALQFVYPTEGFVIWVDCLAIPANPPHLKEAYAFIQFMLQPDIAKQMGLMQGHAITNATGQSLLPQNIQHDPMIYPPATQLTHGHFQGYPGEEAIDLYNAYWQALKLSF
jgi:spermidine/putrescine transport system substrate-binding protein